ncbi:hypothetical protein [Phenylobacterium sp. J367]|uniref:hypothetical protein n=1 Tax=Phenylobacterium sp. J367 TaxID=2898435 RepID=UPI0021510754|nr:hypothetical protein [Phenylobacterium sp. J367]MCR5878729.1 hypothetical protein [Phenylobacterium sp. J367]
MSGSKEQQVRAAAFFMQRAQEAIDQAERAGSEAVGEAFYKEAETWLYMAAKSLKPETAKPPPMRPPVARVGPERRSFGSED